VKETVRGLGRAFVLVLGLVFVVGVTPAGADDVQSSGSGDGVLSGNSVALDVDAPVTLCGLLNGFVVGGIGTGFSFCGATAADDTGPSRAQSSAEGDGVGAGNSLALDVDAPIEIVCNGNGVAVVGIAVGGCVAPPDCGSDCPPPTTCCPPPTTCCPTTTTTCPCPTTTTTSTTTSSTTSSTSSSSTTAPPPPGPRGPELPKTGNDLALQLPLGGGLVSAGALLVWASRRRLARFHRAPAHLAPPGS
jgi:LPXTG-motif cell wall-anchored protein